MRPLGVTSGASGWLNPLGRNGCVSRGANRLTVPPRGPTSSSRTTTASISLTLPATTFSRSASMPGVPFSLTAPR